jgi:hypothetical protein
MDDAVTVTHTQQSKSRAGTSLAAWQQAHEMACRAVVNLCLFLAPGQRTIRPRESTPRRFLAGPQGQGTLHDGMVFCVASSATVLHATAHAGSNRPARRLLPASSDLNLIFLVTASRRVDDEVCRHQAILI